MIFFIEYEAKIDNWLDRELMLELALVLSLEEGKYKYEVVEGLDDGGGVDSKLAVISLPFIKVDTDVDMEVFVTLEVFARLDVANGSMCKSFIRRMSSFSWSELGLSILHFRV